MITEDYVSLEIAELLKEKGFDWNCESNRFYPEPDYDQESPDGVYAPTLQTAMKWLRNQHNLHIMVDCIGSKNYMPTVQFICNSKDIKVESDKNKIGGNGFDSFEEACESTIKYCLEKLI